MRTVAIVMCAMAVGTCAHPVQIGFRLKGTSQSELGERLEAPFSEGTAHPDGLTNCVKLLAKPRAAQSAPERSTLAECTIMRALRNAKPARRSHVSDLKWDEHILELLPPELAITVSGEALRASKRASAEGKTWAETDKSVRATSSTGDQISVKGDGFNERLVLWGRGDFNRDGTEDLLVQTLDTLTEGTYRSTRVYLLTRRTPSGRLSVLRQLL